MCFACVLMQGTLSGLSDHLRDLLAGHGESLLLKVSDDVVVFVVDVFMEWLGFGDWSQRHSGVECSEGP